MEGRIKKRARSSSGVGQCQKGGGMKKLVTEKKRVGEKARWMETAKNLSKNKKGTKRPNSPRKTTGPRGKGGGFGRKKERIFLSRDGPTSAPMEGGLTSPQKGVNPIGLREEKIRASRQERGGQTLWRVRQRQKDARGRVHHGAQARWRPSPAGRRIFRKEQSVTADKSYRKKGNPKEGF